MGLISTLWLIASVLALSQPSLQSGARIEVTLPSGSVTVRGLATLVCTVSGVSKVYNFTWLHDGEVRLERESPYTTITVTRDGTASELSIHDIPSDEAGNYTCIAYISNTSAPLQGYYNLTLKTPPEITAEPNQYVLRGNDAILACNFSANPSPKVVWRRNGSVIGDKETVKYSIPHKGLLKIANATEEDAGIYICTATNDRGSDDFDITLTILTLPVIQSQSGITSSVGQQVVLPCSATGNDTPTISWRLGGVKVGTSNSSRLTLQVNGSLVITNASVMDSGDYLCIAKNLAGNATSVTSLVVNGPPIFLVPPQNTVVQIGYPGNLSCSFLANPNDGGALWQRKNGSSFEDIIPSPRHQISRNGTLIIVETTDADSGEYQCVVTNSKGNITGKINLTVINLPSTPTNLQGKESVGTATYMVTWEAPEQSDTTRPVKYYMIKLQLASDEQTELTIQVPHNQTQYTFTDLIPGSQYHASIAAYNQVGTSNYSALINFTTPPTEPALEYFTVNESETDEARLIFMWKVKYDGGRPINNFLIQYQDVQNSSENIWTDLFTRELDVNKGSYKPESLPPRGRYIFQAVIGNELGNDSYNHSTTFDIPEANPGQPSKPTASEVTKDSVKLSFDLQFMGTGMVKQFVVNITKAGNSGEKQTVPANSRINSSSNMTLMVGGLEVDSTYSFQVAAVNDIGMGPFSEMSDEITTEKDDETIVYIIVGAVGGFVIIVIILLTTLCVCYMCNRRMKAHKHQISINESPDNKKVHVLQDDIADDSSGFMPQYSKPQQPRYVYRSDASIMSPIERSRSLQYRNENLGPSGSTISYGSSIATRTNSLLHAKTHNYPMPQGQMSSSATLISYGSGSQYMMDNHRHWSPPHDFSQRERRSPSSTYQSDGIGKITNMATDV